jgi:hypothetical protein
VFLLIHKASAAFSHLANQVITLNLLNKLAHSAAFVALYALEIFQICLAVVVKAPGQVIV